MEGWLLSSRRACEITAMDHGINRLMEASAKKNIKLSVYSPNEFDLLVTHADDKTILLNDAKVTLPDFIIPRVGANVSYYGLAMIRQLEQMGVYVCNCAESIALSRDKLRIMQILNHHHIPTPKTMLVKFPMSIDRVRTEIGFPLVLKMVSGAKGFGVHLCETENALEEIMEIISGQIKYHPMILQEFIKGSHGRDLRVFVLGGKALACMKRVASRGFKANYSLGGTVEPYPMTPEIEQLALETAALFGLEIAGVDLLFDGDRFKVCEANSSPGFKGIESACHTDIANQVIDYIVSSIPRP